jgi:cell division protein FtsW
VQDRSVGLLLVSTSSLVLIGVAMVLSASSISAYGRFGSSFLFFNRQFAYALVGVLAARLTSRMRHTAWQALSVPLLVVTGFLLLLVVLPGIGTEAGGAARWLALGPVTLQPSEPAKLAIVAFAAALLAKRLRRLDEPRDVLVPMAVVVGVVCGLILLQPDMGTAMIVLLSTFALAFSAGARLRHLAAAAASTTLLGFAAMYAEGYRWARFVSFMNPWADPQGDGYQTIQSLIGLGSGGLFGVGLGAGRQKWMYVPNAHTDFIYSIIGEELGLLGALLVLALFGLVVYAGIRIAMRAPDPFGRLLATGITAWLGIQTLVNLGAVTGLLPITGVPLPFVSFGGSSLIVSLSAVGILVSIGRAGRARARR